MKFQSLLCLLAVFIIFDGCSSPQVNVPPDTSKQVTIKQGVWGNVWFWEGNFGPFDPNGTITPVVRQVQVFEATPSDSVVVLGGGFYSKISAKLVATTKSNSTGFYQVALPVGSYSILALENSLYWSQYENSIGIGGTKVDSNTVTKMQIDINYKAVF